jgi:hypothetical protein
MAVVIGEVINVLKVLLYLHTPVRRKALNSLH